MINFGTNVIFRCFWSYHSISSTEPYKVTTAFLLWDSQEVSGTFMLRGVILEKICVTVFLTLSFVIFSNIGWTIAQKVRHFSDLQVSSSRDIYHGRGKTIIHFLLSTPHTERDVDKIKTSSRRQLNSFGPTYQICLKYAFVIHFLIRNYRKQKGNICRINITVVSDWKPIVSHFEPCFDRKSCFSWNLNHQILQIQDV